MVCYEEKEEITMLNVNLSTVAKVAKKGLKYAGPICTGIVAIASEIDKQKLQETVKDLTKRVAEMESKMR